VRFAAGNGRYAALAAWNQLPAIDLQTLLEASAK